VPLLSGSKEHREAFNAAVAQAVKGENKSLLAYIRSPSKPISNYERWILALLLESGNPRRKIERIIADWARAAFREYRKREGLKRLPKGVRKSIVDELKKIFVHLQGLRINWTTVEAELKRE
jgi:hypothetical protein